MLIGDDGKVESVIKSPHPREKRYDRLIDGEGRTLLPGFIDAHGHVMDLGLRCAAPGPDRHDARSPSFSSGCALMRRRIPTNRWLIGFGWNQELWPDKTFPTAADLDAVVPDRPVVLERVDGHAVVANSAAMRAAGVTAATPAPPGGDIINGLVRRHRAGVDRQGDPRANAARSAIEAFAKAQEILLGFGVTSVGSMSTSLDDWNAFRRAGDGGRSRSG